MAHMLLHAGIATGTGGGVIWASQEPEAVNSSPVNRNHIPARATGRSALRHSSGARVSHPCWTHFMGNPHACFIQRRSAFVQELPSIIRQS